jgi:phosphoglycolate phosphatase
MMKYYGKEQNSPTKKAAIFDLDGTLLQTLPSLTEAVRRTLLHYGLPPFSEERVRSFIGKGGRVLVELMMEASGIDDPEIIDDVYIYYLQELDETCTYKVEPFPGIPEMLQSLHDAGISLAVLSNKGDRVVPHVISVSLPDVPFAVTLGGRDNLPLKPDPTTALKILEKLGASPEHSFFVGDSSIDIRTGRFAGMQTIAVSWGYAHNSEIESENPDYIAHNAKDIADIILR